MHGDIGTLMKKETITKIAGRRYRYEKWYVYHNRSKGTKQRWCYISKKYLELPEITEAIQKEQSTQNTTQITTQNIPTRIHITNNPKFRFSNQTKGFATENISCGFNTDIPAYLPIMSTKELIEDYSKFMKINLQLSKNP